MSLDKRKGLPRMGQYTLEERLLITILGFTSVISYYFVIWTLNRQRTHDRIVEIKTKEDESNAFPAYLCNLSYIATTGKRRLEQSARSKEKQWQRCRSREGRVGMSQLLSSAHLLPKASAQKNTLRHVNPFGLHCLQQILKLPMTANSTKCIQVCCKHHGPLAQNPVFIAIDFEYSDFKSANRGVVLREVGLSILDTQYLFDAGMVHQPVISSYHFRTVSRSKAFLFGTTAHISQASLVAELKTMLYINNTPSDQQRNIIIVGHGVNAEIHKFKSLGIDLRLAPAVVDILDTEKIGGEVLGIKCGLNLGRVVELMGMEGKGFHNAGNDASYTLRAMLLLAVYGYDTADMDDLKLVERIEMYRKIAKF